MVAWLAAKQYATVELHIVSPPPGRYFVFSTVGRSVVFGLGTGLECSVSASDSVSRHSKGDTYAGCVDAAPNESLLVYDRRDTQKDRRVDGRTDGRTDTKPLLYAFRYSQRIRRCGSIVAKKRIPSYSYNQAGSQENISLITIMFCFNEFAFTVQVKHKLNSTQISGFILICLYFTTGHFHTCTLQRMLECSIFLS